MMHFFNFLPYLAPSCQVALPENIADVLPSEARKIRRLRRLMLDNFRLYGYELVIPHCSSIWNR